jgi:hypothetical protein
MKTPPAAQAALQNFREEAHHPHEQIAHQLTEAIKTIASKPANLENLELYLSYHFSEWLKKFANTPETLTAEMKAFAEMEI